MLDSGEGKDRIQQEGRGESKASHFVLTLQEQGAGIPDNRAEHKQEGLLKGIRFVVLSPFQTHFLPSETLS